MKSSEHPNGYPVICLWCKEEKALPDANCCQTCLDAHLKKIKKYSSATSWSEHQASELDHFQGDVVQPTRKDGTINPNFVKVHGTKTLEKEMKLSRETVLKEADRPTKTVAELRHAP